MMAGETPPTEAKTGPLAGPLDRQQMAQVARVLGPRLKRRVSFDVWTRRESGLLTADRDTGGRASDAAGLMAQLKSLHPGFSLTPYDLDRHAERAATEGIEHSPTVVMRSGGHSIRFVGVFHGTLFQPFLDQLAMLSMGRSPVDEQTRALLQGLETDVAIEAFLTPWDPISPRMAPLLGAFAVEGRRVRLTEIEASQFPVLAGKRLVTEVPLLVINGQRFLGFFNEAELAEQVRRVVEGSTEPVIRDRVVTAEYLSEDELRRNAQGNAGNTGPAPSSGSGLIIPGR